MDRKRKGNHPTSEEDPIPNPVREILNRYRLGGRAAEGGPGCPANHDSKFLSRVPREIVEIDNRCGDPSGFVSIGETVLDLGCGAGKICYILSQKVGPTGRVIGVDFNGEKLAVARKHLSAFGHEVGFRNLQFFKAWIQDLALDLDHMENLLQSRPLQTHADVRGFEEECDRIRRTDPLIGGSSIDVVVSDCVLNLFRTEDKRRLFSEIHRVLKPGGRAVISDIVCDREPPPEMRSEPVLWSTYLSGAFREDHLLESFRTAGFNSVEILERQRKPWRAIQGIKFRPVTVRVVRRAEGIGADDGRAPISRNPWAPVDAGDVHSFLRG